MAAVFDGALRRWSLGLLWAACVATGAHLCGDYGVPLDEPGQLGYGETVWRYVFDGDRALLASRDRFYGPAHELALVALVKLLRPHDLAGVYALRHLAGFLLFCAALACLYRIGLRGFGHWVPALAGSLALALSPPLFAHAFFNSKDLAFLSWTVVSVHTLLRLVDDPRPRTALWHALACGFLIDVRVGGVMLPALTLAGLACRGAAAAGEDGLRPRLLRAAALYATLLPAFTLLFWPTLWSDSLGNFTQALRLMSHYPWNHGVLFAGRVVAATDLPWWYAPAWIVVTTPITYLAAFAVGLPATLKRLDAGLRRRGPEAFFPALVLLWLGLPLASAVALRSVLYDGWRHLYFVYPAFLLIAVEGGRACHRAARARWRQRRVRVAAALVTALAAADVAGVAAFMWRAHPYEHVFFNAFVGGVAGARLRWELDYWGLAGREALARIAALDPAPLIPVRLADPPSVANIEALPSADRRRLALVDSTDAARYLVGGHRTMRQEYPWPAAVARVEVDGAALASVFLVHPERVLGPEHRPELLALLQRNERWAGARRRGEMRREVEASVRAALQDYVHGARLLAVDASPFTLVDLRRGLIRNLRVSLRQAEVGDFRRHAPSVRVRRLELVARELVVDLERLRQGELRPADLAELEVEAVELEAGALNSCLARSSGAMRDLRVSFEPGHVVLTRLGRPAVRARLALWVGADPLRQHSDNLWFRVERVELEGWSVPLGWAVQRLLDGHSPLIKPAKLKGRLKLGHVCLDAQRLALGTRVP